MYMYLQRNNLKTWHIINEIINIARIVYTFDFEVKYLFLVFSSPKFTEFLAFCKISVIYWQCI